GTSVRHRPPPSRPRGAGAVRRVTAFPLQPLAGVSHGTVSSSSFPLGPISGASMPGTSLPLLQQRSFGQTSRRDRWWVQPALVFLGLSAFVVYATWAAFQGAHYWVPGTSYLAPFYSPDLSGN